MTSAGVSGRCLPICKSPIKIGPIAVRTSFDTLLPIASTIRRTCRFRPSVIVISMNVWLPESRRRDTSAGRVGPSLVVSGLAYGIDAAVHRGAIETGPTLAVLGCGADVAYPAANRALHRRIGHEGLVLSGPSFRKRVWGRLLRSSPNTRSALLPMPSGRRSRTRA